MNQRPARSGAGWRPGPTLALGRPNGEAAWQLVAAAGIGRGDGVGSGHGAGAGPAGGAIARSGPDRHRPGPPRSRPAPIPCRPRPSRSIRRRSPLTFWTSPLHLMSRSGRRSTGASCFRAAVRRGPAACPGMPLSAITLVSQAGAFQGSIRTTAAAVLDRTQRRRLCRPPAGHEPDAARTASRSKRRPAPSPRRQSADPPVAEDDGSTQRRPRALHARGAQPRPAAPTPRCRLASPSASPKPTPATPTAASRRASAWSGRSCWPTPRPA